jgi:hypothetical protein
MEELNNTLVKVKKTRHKKYVSLGKWIVNMRIAVNNATLPSIYPTMLTVGYDEAKINSLKGKLAELINFDALQVGAVGEQVGATDASDKKRKGINALYLKHRSLLKILLSGNTVASVSMKFNAQRKKSYSEWFQDVSSFYTQLTQTPELTAHAASVGITLPIIDEQKQRLTELQALKETQRKKTADAQQATKLRNRAFDELRPLYTEYIKYARILLASNEALEALGIVVRNKR